MPPDKRKLAILYDPDEKFSPSNIKAIDKFISVAQASNFQVSIISPQYIYNLAEYDVLFIRETTDTKGHTYDMSRTAGNLNLVVVDDPKSIEIGCNKIKQFILFSAYGIPIPRTFIVKRENISYPLEVINKPYILKNPHSSFSRGVFKVEGHLEYHKFVLVMLEKLEAIIVQEYIETAFDWRIGVLDNKPLFACKYYMPKGHWKILKHNRKDEYIDGEHLSVPIKNVPPRVLEPALRAAKILGNGLYGVDVKETPNGSVYVIEVNDNCNIDAGVEDDLQGDSLYQTIIDYFHQRLDWVQYQRLYHSKDSQ